MPTSREKRRSRQRGFTLVELSAVVVIVGILAVIGVVGYRKFVNSSKLTEATDIVMAINAGEAAYFAEKGGYADISKTCKEAAAYPREPGNYKSAWGGKCPDCFIGEMSFQTIGVTSPAPVQFGYTVVAAQPGCDPACRGADLTRGGQVINWGPKGQTDPWFIAHAMAKFDDEDFHVIGSSFSSELITGKP